MLGANFGNLNLGPDVVGAAKVTPNIENIALVRLKDQCGYWKFEISRRSTFGTGRLGKTDHLRAHKILMIALTELMKTVAC
jgi:hypothetical protein